LQFLRILVIFIFLPLTVQAQGANIALGGLSVDPDAAIEISADALRVDQATGTAVFDGNVVIGQGSLRLAAGRVEVVYGEESGEITRLRATGGVTFVTETEAAEAASADYNLVDGTLTLTGNVLLTQGAGAISADQMIINLRDGTAQMQGRVRTVFQQAGDN